MNARDRQVVVKILKESSVISELIEGFNFELFSADEKTKRAVCMTLINIGELVKLLSDDFRAQHSNIPWRAIAGLRDVAAHKYQTLQMGDIWLTVEKDIPLLQDKIRNILETP